MAVDRLAVAFIPELTAMVRDCKDWPTVFAYQYIVHPSGNNKVQRAVGQRRRAKKSYRSVVFESY